MIPIASVPGHWLPFALHVYTIESQSSHILEPIIVNKSDLVIVLLFLRKNKQTLVSITPYTKCCSVRLLLHVAMM